MPSVTSGMKEGIQTNVLCTEVNNSYQISNFIFDKNLKMNKPYTEIMILVLLSTSFSYRKSYLSKQA